MALSIGGLGSGLDTAAIISQLMQVERLPQQKLQAQGAAAGKQVSTWNDLRTKVQALLTSAEALRTPGKALAPVASSTNATAVRATAQDGATLGQTTVVVKQLATAQSRRVDGLGPASMTVGAGTTVLTSGRLGSTEGKDVLDLSGAKAGTHVVTVTRASSAATAYGTLPASLAAGSTNLTVTLGNGSTTSVSLSTSYPAANGSASMLEDLQTQLGGVAEVSLVAGRLSVRTLEEGSAQALTFGGPAAAALGLPAEQVRGSSALLTVDGQRVEVEPEPGGGTRGVSLGDSGIVLTVGGSLGLGTVRSNVVTTTASSTLADLQGMLSANGSPVTASLVADGKGGSTLLMTSTSTGTAGGVHVTPGHSVLDPATAGTTHTTTDGVDAQVEVGGVLATRSSNTITDLVPGVTLDLLHRPRTATGADEPVTLTVARDGSGTKDKVKALVDGMNALLGAVKTATRYDVATGTGGPLVGNAVARSLSSSVFSKASAVVGSGDLRTLAQLGIQTTRDGTFSFDAAVLSKAVDTAPDDVARVVAGLADGLAAWAKEASRTGGLLTTQRDGADAQVTARRRQAEAMETRLDRTEARYRRQFAALDTAMARLTAQSNAFGSALGGLGLGR